MYMYMYIYIYIYVYCQASGAPRHLVAATIRALLAESTAQGLSPPPGVVTVLSYSIAESLGAL